jgi:F-type H+-transporting ATPase subunit gamma
MANLKEIRTRITSVTSTKQITSAMKMVAAARLKKAQDAIIQIRPYAGKLHEILQTLSANIDKEEGNVYGEIREIKKVLIVVVTSNRGLCGAFNMNIIKMARDLAASKYEKEFNQGNVDFYTIGKKGWELFGKKGYNVFKNNMEIFNDLNFENAKVIAEEIMQLFVNKEYDSIELVYNSFRNPAIQDMITEKFLPIEIVEDKSVKTHLDYIFEPSKNKIIKELIPRSLKTQFYKALIDSLASEHGARMTAMHKATENASDLIKELNIQYNKARQASITSEIIEIVSGAEALNG